MDDGNKDFVSQCQRCAHLSHCASCYCLDEKIFFSDGENLETLQTGVALGRERGCQCVSADKSLSPCFLVF